MKQKILIIRFDHIGDWLIFNSVWQPYFQQYQNQIHVDFIVSQKLFSIIQETQKDFCHSLKSFNQADYSTKGWPFWKQYFQITLQRYQFIINPIHSRTFITEGLLRFPFLGSKRIGSSGDACNTHSPEEWALTQQKYDLLIPVSDHFQFERNRNIEFLQQLFQNHLHLPALPESTFKVAPQTPSSNHLFVIAPTTASSIKNWPIPYFAALILELYQQNNHRKFFITGAPNEDYCIPEFQEFFSNNNPEINGSITYHFGDLSFLEVQQTIQQSQMLIGNDTSLFHAAALVGVPAVCIGNGTILNRFYPYPKEFTHTRSVFPPSLPIENRTITSVTVPQVLEACNELLQLSKP